MDNNFQIPIDHISYSAMRLFCSDQLMFFKEYVLKIRDRKSSPAMVVGKSAHKALDIYYKTKDFEKGVSAGLSEMEKTPDSAIDYGKTGNRGDMITDYTKALQFYRDEEPDFGKVIATEDSVTTDQGFSELLPLPIKTIIDVVSEQNNLFILRDYKFVTQFEDPNEEVPEFIIQSMFNFIGAKAKYKRAPDRMDFYQIKKTKNKDGSPQVVPYIIDFAKHPEYQSYFTRLYTDVVITIANPAHRYLPNFGDMMNGKEAWKEYSTSTVDPDLVQKISHADPVAKQDRYVQFNESKIDNDQTLTQEDKIRVKLQEFGIPVRMEDTHKGLNVTLYTMTPSRGVMMSKFLAHAPDIALALEAKSVRVQAPIPGTGLVGFEISNQEQGKAVWKKDLLKPETLEIPVGVDVYGKTTYLDLTKAPHLLIGGATGAGKSIFMDVIINSLLKQNSPSDLKMMLIDPKRTEFNEYAGERHLIGKIITEAEDAELALQWAVEEMEARYKQLQQLKVKTIQEYRKRETDMPYIVIVIDELADLMLSGNLKAEIENKIVRLAQKARAVGIHLVVATQRPSVNVVTGLIKANFPTRVSFMVATSTDSKVILDTNGAEKLLGNGDLLLMNPRKQGLERLQGYIRE